MMFSVRPKPGSSLTSRTDPFAGPCVVCRFFLRYCCARPTRIMRSSVMPSPVFALVGMRAIVEVKFLMWSNRSVRKPWREKVPMIS